MDLFVSTFQNRVDAKGRVSVPADFRAVLAREGADAVFLYPTPGAEALDAGGPALMQSVAGLMAGLGPYSEQRDVLSTAIFGDSAMVKLDGDGRIILPETMRSHAQIEDRVTFVGLGSKFQLWEPGRFAAHLQRAREDARALRESFGDRRGSRPTG